MSIEKLSESIEEKKIELKNFKFQLPEFATNENRDQFNMENFEMIHENIQIKVCFGIQSSFDTSTNKIGFIELHITISTQLTKDIADIFITIRENQDELSYRANTVVRNDGRHLKGLGRTLWLMSVDLIQELSQKLNYPIYHIVKRWPDKNLGPLKWDELFLPLLKTKGYKDRGASSWEKIYEPIKT